METPKPTPTSKATVIEHHESGNRHSVQISGPSQVLERVSVQTKRPIIVGNGPIPAHVNVPVPPRISK